MSEKINPEIMSLRTKTSKTYDIGNGKRRLVLSSLDPILTIQGVGKDTYIKNIGSTSNYGDLIYMVVGQFETGEKKLLKRLQGLGGVN